MWDGPLYPYYSTNCARMQSFASWLTASKQKPENFSNAVFFHAGILMDKNSIYYKVTHFLQKPCLM